MSIDNCIGIDDVKIDKINKVTLRNMQAGISVDNVMLLDISHIDVDMDYLFFTNVKEIIINEEQYETYLNKLDGNFKKIIVTDDRREVIKEISYD